MSSPQMFRPGDHVRILTHEIPAQVGEITRTFTDNPDADVLVRALTGITYPARTDELEPLAEPGADYEDDPYVRDVVSEWNDDQLDDALPASTEPLDPGKTATDGGNEKKESTMSTTTIIPAPTSDPSAAISANIKRLLRERGMSRREFAAALGLTGPQLDHRMRANTSWFVNEVFATCELLGVPIQDVCRTAP